MKDVGDALNMYLQESKDVPYLMVDFGIDKAEVDIKSFCDDVFRCYSPWVDAFLLSHFHSDHYNGFEIYAEAIDFNNAIYVPRFPEYLKEFASEFRKMILADLLLREENLFVRVLLQILRRSSCRASVYLLSKGDVFYHNKYKYEVLWPPKTYTDDCRIITETTQRAIRLFNDLKEKDKSFKEIYDALDSCNLINDEEANLFFFNDESIDVLENLWEKYSKVEVKKIVARTKYKEFNKALQDAANRLSIAFRQEDNVLFLGDLEAHELQCVAKELKKREQLHYDCVIAAHHGTHWNRSMRDLNCDNCLASVGKTLASKVDTHYKTISSRLFLTHQVNDIVLQKNQYLIL